MMLHRYRVGRFFTDTYTFCSHCHKRDKRRNGIQTVSSFGNQTRSPWFCGYECLVTWAKGIDYNTNKRDAIAKLINIYHMGDQLTPNCTGCGRNKPYECAYCFAEAIQKMKQKEPSTLSKIRAWL